MGVSTAISKDMIIADILEIDEYIAQILMESGMRCIGCPAARGESLEDACEVHGADADAIVDAVNDYLADK